MKSGGWAQAESYRELIKDKETAISLEQQSRMRLIGESLEQQIAETYARHKAEPTKVDLVRRLGALNEQKENLDASLGWYQYAADLTKGADTGLVRKASDLKIKCLEREIAAHEEFLSTHSVAHELHAKKFEELLEIRPIFTFGSTWASTSSVPDIFGKPYRSCSVRGKIRTRV
jgi:hypothetical protein